MESSSVARISSDEVVAIRTMHGLKTSEFASILNVNIKTIERWEKGESVPSGTAATILDLIRRYPETIDRLKVDDMPFDLRLKIYKNKDIPILVCVIDVNEIDRFVEINNYTSNLEDLPFGEKLRPTYEEYDKFIRSLCNIKRGRGVLTNPIDELIKSGGNKEYKVDVCEKLGFGRIKVYSGGSKGDSRRKYK